MEVFLPGLRTFKIRQTWGKAYPEQLGRPKAVLQT
jgi:hypothetical protein